MTRETERTNRLWFTFSVIGMMIAFGAGLAIGTHRGYAEGARDGEIAALHDASIDAQMVYLLCLAEPPACNAHRDAAKKVSAYVEKRVAEIRAEPVVR